MRGTTQLVFFDAASYRATPVCHAWGDYRRVTLVDDAGAEYLSSTITTACGAVLVRNDWRELPDHKTATIRHEERKFFTLRADNALKFARLCERCMTAIEETADGEV